MFARRRKEKTKQVQVPEMKDPPYQDKPRHHRHKCDQCFTIWEHGDDKQGNGAAHCCPKCHYTVWSKYEGPKPPTQLVTEATSAVQSGN